CLAGPVLCCARLAHRRLCDRGSRRIDGGKNPARGVIASGAPRVPGVHGVEVLLAPVSDIWPGGAAGPVLVWPDGEAGMEQQDKRQDGSLESYIEAAAAALALPIEAAWKPAIAANLAVNLRLAAQVSRVELADEAEPAPVYGAER